ncbi:MAG: helix-turn-helix domain-containing protein [Oscillospiraceae bacterium]|nr:helix-turn-helix domain-containing protein [Oscillospiraceae bacterium]
MADEKILMAEAATLYYEKNCTQQEIAARLGLSRQTISKLLNDAIKENIVEIKIHNPIKDCKALEIELCEKFNIASATVCGTSGKGEDIRIMMTVKAACDYLKPILEKGNQKIAVSWGRTIQSLIGELPEMKTQNNVVFPLFGATDTDRPYFLSNEIARSMADKIGAAVKYAWFPYLPDDLSDCDLLKKTSYYKKLQGLWDDIDLALVGIGNTDVLELFGKTFGYSEKKDKAIGDIATHFFSEDGEVLGLYENTLCASYDNLKNAKQIVAVACGEDKVKAIRGALRSGLVNTLVTDEHTAKQILGK